MSVLDNLLGIIAPHDCVGCGIEGRLLCSGCTSHLKPAVKRCFRCQQPTLHSQTCQACLMNIPLNQGMSACAYSGPAKALLWKLKSAGAQTAADEMAKLMTPLLSNVRKSAVLIPVPTASSRVRQRGYDQAKLLAKALSRQTGLPYHDLLTRQGQSHQVGANRATRQQQLQTAFRVKNTYVSARQVILVDDVLTTGATLTAAAQILSRAGAQNIRAITFAQA